MEKGNSSSQPAWEENMSVPRRRLSKLLFDMCCWSVKFFHGDVKTSSFKETKESQGSDWWWCILEHMNPKNDAWFRN